MEDPRVRLSIATLLSSAGLDADGLAIESAVAGGNNRVFVVHAGGARYLAKAYFSHPADKRDRLATEFAFLSYAWDIGLRCIPRPIARAAADNVGLYEFVEGRKLASTELTREHLSQAAQFFLSLNVQRNRPQAGGLPQASEACFSIEEHFALVERRIERLRNLPTASVVDQEALSFVAELQSAWQKCRQDISQHVGSSRIGAALAAGDRCLSPSDYGFHNALARDTGQICFIDFEYAGWDDPAKAIGDFFCQPGVPVSFDYFEDYLAKCVSYSSNAQALGHRVRTLLPVFQIKWCCILLNEFLPDAAQRRRFANPTTEPEHRKRTQLEKAQRFFTSITNQPWPT